MGMIFLLEKLSVGDRDRVGRRRLISSILAGFSLPDANPALSTTIFSSRWSRKGSSKSKKESSPSSNSITGFGISFWVLLVGLQNLKKLRASIDCLWGKRMREYERKGCWIRVLFDRLYRGRKGFKRKFCISFYGSENGVSGKAREREQGKGKEKMSFLFLLIQIFIFL